MSVGLTKPTRFDIEEAIKNTLKYSNKCIGDNYLVTKDHGDYLEVKAKSNNKDHIIFNLYYDAVGRIIRVERYDY